MAVFRDVYACLSLRIHTIITIYLTILITTVPMQDTLMPPR